MTALQSIWFGGMIAYTINALVQPRTYRRLRSASLLGVLQFSLGFLLGALLWFLYPAIELLVHFGTRRGWFERLGFASMKCPVCGHRGVVYVKSFRLTWVAPPQGWFALPRGEQSLICACSAECAAHLEHHILDEAPDEECLH